MTVYLVVLDCARRDRFDEHAEELIQRSDTHADCIAASTWSIPSHASLWSGRLPHEHQVHSHNPNFSELDIWDDLSIGGISANSAVSDVFGVHEIWDEFKSYSGNVELTPDAITVKEAMERWDPTWS